MNFQYLDLSLNNIETALYLIFFWLQIVFDAVYIAARTVLFVALVVHNKNNALAAFAFAQVSSSILFCLMYYIFFWWYIRQFNYVQSLLKNDKDVVRQMPKMFTRMQDFKFKSVKEFLPGCMDNTGVRFKNKTPNITPSIE